MSAKKTSSKKKVSKKTEPAKGDRKDPKVDPKKPPKRQEYQPHSFVEQLPCQLTPEEVRARGEKLARVQRQVDKKKAEKRELVGELTADIKTLEGQVSELAEEVSSGQAIRSVDCQNQPRYRKGVMETVRLDKGEVINSRPLTEDERQTTFLGHSLKNPEPSKPVAK